MVFAGFAHGCLPFLDAPPGRPRPRLARGPIGDTVEPAADRCTVADGRGFARQHEKGGLKGVLRVLASAEHAPAYAEDHRAVASDEGLKGGLIAFGEVALEELGVLRCSTALAQRGTA